MTHFTPQCFAEVANSFCKHENLPDCEFLGVLYDNVVEGWTYALPQNGVNVLDHAVYWKLPYGTVHCWSLDTLLSKKDTDLREKHDKKAYIHMAKSRGYHCLGVLRNTDRDKIRNDRTAWKSMPFQIPDDEKSPCY